MRRPVRILLWMLLSPLLAWAEPAEKAPGSDQAIPGGGGPPGKAADAPRRLAQHYHAVFGILKKSPLQTEADCEKALDRVGAYLVGHREDFARIRRALDDSNPERAAKINQRIQAALAKVYSDHMQTVHLFGKRCRGQLHELEELLDQAVLGKPTAHTHEGHSHDNHGKKNNTGEHHPEAETPDAGPPDTPRPGN